MLTQEQIDSFHEHGFLIMRGLIQRKELELLQTASDRVQTMGFERQGSGHAYRKNQDGIDIYWRSENMWSRDDIFRIVTVNPALLENIGQCIGHSFYPWNDSLVVKLRDLGAQVPWHQDPPYDKPSFANTYPIPNFTTDIYLDHSGTDNGCVWAIPNRHLEGHIQLKQLTEEQLYQEAGAIPIEMEAGDVLFHCLSTPHGSRQNLSTIQRRIFYIHYLNDEVYSHAYGDLVWAKSKPGWGEERKLLIESMLQKRMDMGFSMPDEHLKLEGDGFRFIGRPVTPTRHWDKLAAKGSHAKTDE